jgi:hypothetical protein
VLFIYAVRGEDHDIWFLLFLLLFIELNILLMDFALWNYYEGRKEAMIWLIETLVIAGVFYLLFQQ